MLAVQFGLALAELAALLPDAALQEETSQAMDSGCGWQGKRQQEALTVASGLQCFLVDGYVASTEENTTEGWLNEMQAYLHDHPVSGSVAVRAWKQGSKLPVGVCPTSPVASGACFTTWATPLTLNLPDHVLALISDGPMASLACGWMVGDGQAAFSTVSGGLVSGRSSNRSALTPCWLTCCQFIWGRLTVGRGRPHDGDGWLSHRSLAQ